MDVYGQQKTNGNFDIVDSISGGVYARIVATVTGWRVLPQIAGRRRSRTTSVTPEEAARKYLGHKVPFFYLGGAQ